MMRRWREWMRRRGSYKMIERDEGCPYLERFYLLKVPILGWGLFLHCFWDSDEPILHDHPWWWARLVLSGGYDEIGADDTATWCGRGHFAIRGAEHFHRVRLPGWSQGETWTLFLHGKRWRDWGFLLDGDWTHAVDMGATRRYVLKGWVFPRVEYLVTTGLAS